MLKCLKFLFSVVIVSIVLTNFFTSKVLAAQLSGRVIDSLNTPLTNSKVIVKDASSQKAVTTFITDPFGNYVLQVPKGRYTMTIIPPTGSDIQEMSKTITVSGNTTENITMQTASKLPIKQNESTFATKSNLVLLVLGILLAAIISFIFWKKKSK